MNDPILKQVHLAAQYLAMAGASFLPQKKDDSHTNMAFIPETGTLETRLLNNSGVQLIFDYSEFSLKWGANTKESFPLDGKSHKEIIAWIDEMASTIFWAKGYAYVLHYNIPYSATGDFKFRLPNADGLKELLRLRKLAHLVLHSFLNGEGLQSDIRVWPHHFDTGAFVLLDEHSGKSLGLGMAIPDAICDEHYFYISGYLGHDAIDVSNYKKITYGTWKNTNIKGALLPATKVDPDSAIQFFQEALKSYRH
ncbi:MAG: hypothetical protein AAFX53_08900 [Bacteroidota bacterium]